MQKTLRPGRRIVVAVTAITALVGGAVSPALATGHRERDRGGVAKAARVLLLSVDGLHQSDLDWYIGQHPQSALASLVRGGIDYTHASTPLPSDSFPGMVGLVTGGNPGTTGVYYDVSYNHALLPAGTTKCSPGAPLGAAVNYDESADKVPTALDAGQGLSGLPASILGLTGNARSLLNAASLPVDPKTCTPVFPHSYLRVNTVFDVAHSHGLPTAWSDKHAAYDVLTGPSGTGIDDLFTPEINSDAPGGGDWTSNNDNTMQYDSFKLRAVLNEIDGSDHSGQRAARVPAIFGMNFQTVSTAEKLPMSGTLAGGYLPGSVTPGPLLSRALDFINASVGALSTELWTQGLADSTTIVLSAKHGQSPRDPQSLTRIDDGPLIDGINAAWKSTHSTAPDLVASATDDDAMIMWLSDRSQAAAEFVKAYLLAQNGTGNDISGASKPFTASGLATVYAGAQAKLFFHASLTDPAAPDLYATVQHGVVFTGKKKKIAEHGGAEADDRNVPIVIAGAHVVHGLIVTSEVETTQLAPSILRLLGLEPNQLDAVRAEHTAVLPRLS